MSFKVLVEQTEIMNGLKRIKCTLGKGKGSSSGSVDTSGMVYMEVTTNQSSKIPVLKMITNNGYELTECYIDILSGEIGISVLVEYSKLVKMVGTIDPTIEILLQSDCSKLSLNYVGRVKPIILNGIGPENFLLPPEEQVQEVIKIPLVAIKEGVQSIAPFIVDNSASPLYNCINIEIKSGKAIFQALSVNTNMVLIYVKDTAHKNDINFFIECNKLNKMVDSFDDSKDVNLSVSGNNSILEQDDIKQNIRLLQGTYPDFRSFMLRQYVVEAIVVKEDFLVTIDRAKILSDSANVVSKPIVINFTETFININLQSQFGFIFESIPCKLKGKPFSMAFNIESLYAAVKAIKGDKVRIGFSTRSGCVVSPLISTGFKQLIFVPSIKIANN